MKRHVILSLTTLCLLFSFAPTAEAGPLRWIRARRAAKAKLTPQQQQHERRQDVKAERIVTGALGLVAIGATIAGHQLGYNPHFVTATGVSAASLTAAAAIPGGRPGLRTFGTALVSAGALSMAYTHAVAEAVTQTLTQIITLGGLL